MVMLRLLRQRAALRRRCCCCRRRQAEPAVLRDRLHRLVREPLRLTVSTRAVAMVAPEMDSLLAG